MIDVFESLDTSNLNVDSSSGLLRWLNIFGVGKCGKTTFAAQFMKEFRTLYFDTEEGTNFIPDIKTIKVGNLQDMRKAFTFCHKNLDKLQPDIAVIDTLDVLYEMVAKDYCAKNGISNISDVPHGKGWHEVREIFSATIDSIRRLSPLLITITHVNLKALGDESESHSFVDLDLPGKLKTYVQNTADANIQLMRKRDDEGNSYLGINLDTSLPHQFAVTGSRVPELHDIETADELFDYLTQHLNERRAAA